MYSAEEQRKLDKTTSCFVFVICMISILFCLISAPKGRLDFGVLVLMGGLLGALGLLLISKLIDENPLGKLTEYRGKGTINGIKASQIFEDLDEAKA